MNKADIRPTCTYSTFICYTESALLNLQLENLDTCFIPYSSNANVCLQTSYTYCTCRVMQPHIRQAMNKPTENCSINSRQGEEEKGKTFTEKMK